MSPTINGDAPKTSQTENFLTFNHPLDNSKLYKYKTKKKSITGLGQLIILKIPKFYGEADQHYEMLSHVSACIGLAISKFTNA